MKKKFWPKKLFGRLWRLRSNFDKFFWKKKNLDFFEKNFFAPFSLEKKVDFEKKFFGFWRKFHFRKNRFRAFFSPSFHSKEDRKIFEKFFRNSAFAKNFLEKWPKIGKNRLCFDLPKFEKSKKIDSPVSKVRGIASVQQSKFLKISRWARKTHLQAPILFPRRVTGKMKILGSEKKNFFSEKFFFDRKVQKKWVFKNGIFGPFGAHLGELERFWVFGHFLGRVPTDKYWFWHQIFANFLLNSKTEGKIK